LRHAMDGFIGTDAWEEAQAIVEQHPVLLRREADIVLLQGIETSRAAGDTDMEETCIEHLDLLRVCRTVGVERAFAEKVDGSGRTLKLNLASIYSELASLPEDSERRGALARVALQRLRREDDAETWAQLEQTVGGALMASARRGDVGAAEEAAEHFAKALEVCTRKRDPETWATLKRQLAESLELTLGD
jgi:hypothetical protein